MTIVIGCSSEYIADIDHHLLWRMCECIVFMIEWTVSMSTFFTMF